MRDIEFRAVCNETGELLGDQAYNGQCFAWLAEGLRITIEQFTGLLDKNGTKIFEGDKIQSYHFTDANGRHYFVNHIVEWSDKFNGWFMRNEESGDDTGCIQAWVYMRNNKHSAKIIGNIHE